MAQQSDCSKMVFTIQIKSYAFVHMAIDPDQLATKVRLLMPKEVLAPDSLAMLANVGIWVRQCPRRYTNSLEMASEAVCLLLRPLFLTQLYRCKIKIEVLAWRSTRSEGMPYRANWRELQDLSARHRRWRWEGVSRVSRSPVSFPFMSAFLGAANSFFFPGSLWRFRLNKHSMPGWIESVPMLRWSWKSEKVLPEYYYWVLSFFCSCYNTAMLL
jgi:hypothetical protein